MLFDLSTSNPQDSPENQIRQLKSVGAKIPDRLLNQPRAHEHLHMFMEAFNNLSTGRTNSESGPSAISWMTIEEYCDRLGYGDSLRWRTHEILRDMDNAFLKHCREEIARANKEAMRKAKK